MLGKGYFTFTLESGMRYKVVGRGGYRSGLQALWKGGNMLGVCRSRDSAMGKEIRRPGGRYCVDWFPATNGGYGISIP